MKIVFCLFAICLASAFAWEFKGNYAAGYPAARWGHGAYGQGAWGLARAGWGWNNAAYPGNAGYAGYGGYAGHGGYAGWPAARGAWGWAGAGHAGTWSHGYGSAAYARPAHGYGAWNAWKRH